MTPSDLTSVDQVRKLVERHTQNRQVNKILHGFPSPRLWKETDIPARDLLAARAHAKAPRPTWLYVASPYCIRTDPDRCGYCLFPVEVYTGNKDLEVYLDHLEKEVALYQGLLGNSSLTDVFFGGGTANLYRADQYDRLMAIVRSAFEIPSGATVTMEGIPQLFTKEKMQRMKASGINRISIGAQQLNDELNKLSGRRQTVGDVLNSVAWSHELGLPCNVDLIFGWPQQTVATMVKDLELLVSTGVYHITHYELNVAGPTDFAINRRDELPTVAENVEMYRVAGQLLRAAGYRQLTAYEWQKDEGGPVLEECIRTFDSRDRLAFGYAGISTLDRCEGSPAWTYRVHASLKDYFDDVSKGRLPVEMGYCLRSEEDYRLTNLFSHIQGLSIDRAEWSKAFGVDLIEEHAPFWEVFGERGFVEIDAQTLRVVGDGGFWIPMMQTLISTRRFNELVRAETARSRSLPIVDQGR